MMRFPIEYLLRCQGRALGGLMLMASVLLGVPAVAEEPLPRCGVTEQVKLCGEGACSPSPVLRAPGGWHGLAQCLRSIRDLWHRRGAGTAIDFADRRSVPIVQLAREQLLGEMYSARVGFTVVGADQKILPFSNLFDDELTPRWPLSRALFLNDRRKPYNAMGQTGVAYFLDHLASLADADKLGNDAHFYRDLAKASVATVLAPADEGGLSSMASCAGTGRQGCRWFHSITRRDRPAAWVGATLNQHLHAVRDLGFLADRWQKNGQDTSAINRAVDEGINQLFLGNGHHAVGEPPNLADFVAPAVGSKELRWSYYGFDTRSPAGRGGYFLGDVGKNCSYHRHSLDLIAAILKRAESLGRVSDARRVASECRGPLYLLYRTAVTGAAAGDGLPGKSSREEGTNCEAQPGWLAKARYLNALFRACPG